MRIPRLPARPWIAGAAIVVAAAILLTVLQQGNANANTGPPETPDNTLAHLIVPDGEEPRIRVSWDAPDAEVSDYTITRADGKIFSADGAATTFSDHSLEPGTTYAYSVAANSAQGSSPASESANADVPDVPSTPGNLAGAVAEPDAADETATVNLTWLASTVPAPDQCDTAYPLTGYTIFRSDGNQETEIGTADAGAMSFSDDTAAFSTSYTYRVAARNAIGASSAGTSVAIFSRPVLPPTGLTASITDPFDGNISLSWNAPTEGAEIIGYSVHRYLGPDPYAGTDVPVTLDEQATQTYLVDTTAEPGVTYSYIVIARSAFNVSLPSNIAAIEAPAPPAGLTATAGNGAIDLSWSTPTAGMPDTYRVERQTFNDEWTNVADTATTSHSDDTAQRNTAYRYRVQHRNQYGGSTWAKSGNVTLLAVPGRPTGLVAAVDGNDNILSWTGPEDSIIDGYRVRHRIADADWNLLAESVDSTDYRHVDAAADVTHHYAVQAHNSAGNGPWSEPTSATRITPPDVPQNVSAQLDGNDIVVSWERPDTVHISGYTVRHQAGDETPVDSERLPESQTNFRMADVAGDVAYRIAVRAHNDAGDSPWSNDVEIMRRLAPSAPTNFAVAVGEADIVLSWDAPTTGTADGYRVEYGEQDSEQAQTVPLTADQTSYTHSANVEGTTYRYRVRAHNTAGDGPWTNPLTAARTLAPPAPTDLVIEVSGSAITLSWTAAKSGVIDTYEVRYSVSGSDTTTTASVAASETSFLHLGADGDITYSYRVRSVNSAGNSDWAGPVEAMWVIPPGVPANVSAAISGDDILVSWNRPAGNFIDQYLLQVREQNTERWTSVNVAATQTSHRHASPTPGATYEYRVRTQNAGGVSQWSNIATAVWYQNAAPPQALIFTPFGDRMLIRWRRSETPGVTGYQLRYRIDGGEWSQEDLTVSRYFANWSSDQSYHEYQVRAVRDTTAGDWSAIHRATVATPGAVPSLTLNREGAYNARLHWTEPESGPPARYVIEGRWADQSNYTVVTYVGAPATTTTVNVGPGSEFTYRVLAQNHFGTNGPHQDGVTAHVVMPDAERQWPDAPSTLSVTMLDPGTVQLMWLAPSQDPEDVSHYRIYRKPVSDTRTMGASYRDHILVAYTNGAATSYIDHTAEAGIAYEYSVAAYWDGHEGLHGPISHRAYARPW